MFTKVAKHMNKWLSYPSDLLAAMSMVAMVFIMLSVVADVLMRWLFRSPINGSRDLVFLAFSIVVWGSMALAAFKGSHVAMTTVLDRFPRLPRLCFQLLGALVSSLMMGVVSWRLVILGTHMAQRIARTGVLKIPYEPFLYFAAAGCGLMALVFLARVPEIVGKIRKEQ
jgi:TRAP-type C4-dicarboxylate transport system permease small subunit